eukprot:Gb_11082 [translate_table: standard]
MQRSCRLMARKGTVHSNSFPINASVDMVAPPESAGAPLTEQGIGFGTAIMQEGIGISKEDVHNLNSPGKKSSNPREKSHRSRGSGDSKKGAGQADGNPSKGRSPVSGPTGTKETSSKTKGVNKAGENGVKANGPVVGEAMGHHERMANADSCCGSMPQCTDSEYAGISECMDNGMNDEHRHVEGDRNNKNKVLCVLNLFKQSSEWIQQQKPALLALIALVLQARDFVIPRIKHTWPIVCAWLLHFGRLSLLLFILWLDCSLRGLDSLVRLGTTSFFVVIWCSFLSIIAMAGCFNVLMTLGIVCVAAFFLGYTAAILTMAVFGTVVLWIYGSFWTTGLFFLIGAITFALNHEHLALLITTLYSMYCAKVHVGWLGMVLGLNLAFISSDILIYFLKINASENKGKGFDEQTRANKGRAGNFSHGSGHTEGAKFHSERPSGESSQTSQFGESHGRPATSGLTEGDPTSAEEVIRLLDSPDHYAVLGLSRYENIDIAVLKREYRKKAILVHPDKNMGNVKAEEAFKKLQNAYEVLLDSVKRKIYDEELRREELVSCFRRFRSGSQRNGRYGPFKYGYGNSEDEGEDLPADSRRIACKKCNGSHVWILTDRTKARARWCQDCQDYHQAKDGDGWIEQTSHMFLFGMLRKMDAPHAYACAESKIYDATEWVLCQGMVCPPNTHKPTFHVSTNITGKSNARGGGWSQKAGTNSGMPTNLDENMTEEEFFEWLQNAMASGMFDSGNGVPENAGMKTGNHPKNNRKKRKGKKQW